MLKALIGQGHSEFAGTRQQDAQEFLIWLLSRIQRQGKPTGNVEKSLLVQQEEVMKDDDEWGGYVDPTKCFKFAVQQRIQCLGCGGVKYRVDEQDNINIPVPDHLKQYFPPLSCIYLDFLLPLRMEMLMETPHQNTNLSILRIVSGRSPQKRKLT